MSVIVFLGTMAMGGLVMISMNATQLITIAVIMQIVLMILGHTGVIVFLDFMVMDGRVEMWMSAQTTSTTAVKTQFVVMPLGLITALV